MGTGRSRDRNRDMDRNRNRARVRQGFKGYIYSRSCIYEVGVGAF